MVGTIIIGSYTAKTTAYFSSASEDHDSASITKQVTDPNYFNYLPAIVTPPGPEEKIVFASDMGNTLNMYDIFVMSVDGTNITNLTNTPSTSETKPVWSPDGTKIAYISDPSASEEIYIMNADGTNKINVSNAPTAQDRAPSWSPDSTKISFMSDRNAAEDIFDIFVVNIDGTSLLNLTNSPDKDDRGPDWSPVGSRIAFSSETSVFHSTIVSMNTDGSQVETLYNATGATISFNPNWSPDGSLIAFAWLGSPDTYITKMNADGSSPVYWPTNMDLNWFEYIKWNATGSNIAFTGADSQTNGLFLIDTSNGVATNLPENLTAPPSGLNWSVNDDKIVYAKGSITSPFQFDIFVINADGTDLTNITNLDSSNEKYPDWALVPPN